VIESVAEDPKVKIDFYTKIANILDERTIIVTNSSTMIPSTFAKYTGREDKYLALHFANEIWKNNMAEVMGHAGTDEKYFDAVVEFAKQISMVPIKIMKEQPGYLLNSLLVPLLGSALGLWAKGVATPEDIDSAWEIGYGTDHGPFRVIDVIGLNTVYNVFKMDPDASVEGTPQC